MTGLSSLPLMIPIARVGLVVPSKSMPYRIGGSEIFPAAETIWHRNDCRRSNRTSQNRITLDLPDHTADGPSAAGKGLYGVREIAVLWRRAIRAVGSNMPQAGCYKGRKQATKGRKQATNLPQVVASRSGQFLPRHKRQQDCRS